MPSRTLKRQLSRCELFSQALISNIQQDIRGCAEQLQTIEKEVHFLQVAQKELADLKDHLDGKNIERNELRLRQEASPS